MTTNNSVGKEERIWQQLAEQIERYNNPTVIKWCKENLMPKQPLSPQSSVGVEEKDLDNKITNHSVEYADSVKGKRVNFYDIYKAGYLKAMTEYSSILLKEKDEQLRYCHKRMCDAYSEIDHLKAKVFAKDILNISLEKSETKLQQLLSEKEKEIADLKERVINLQQADMTHEYNNAEAERVWPQIKQQIIDEANEEKDKAFNRIHENLILGNYEEANRIALQQLKQSPIN